MNHKGGCVNTTSFLYNVMVLLCEIEYNVLEET